MFSIDLKSEDWKGLDLNFIQHVVHWQAQVPEPVYTTISACQLVFQDGYLVAVGEEVLAKCNITTMVKEGFIRFTHITCHTSLHFTVHYNHTVQTAQQAMHYHNQLEVLPGIIVHYQTFYQGNTHFLQVFDDVHCHAHTQLNYFLASHETPQALKVIHQLSLKLAEHASAQIFLGLLHFLLHSFTVKGELQGNHAQLHLKGIAYLGQTACNHRIFRIQHACSNTTSALQLLTCTTEQARFIARASSDNAPHLQHLTIHQKFKGILLSDTSIISLVPSLRIHAGGVQATHSVAIYTLQKPHLWYLSTRGLTYIDISHLVVMNLFQGVLFSCQEAAVEASLLQNLLRLL